MENRQDRLRILQYKGQKIGQKVIQRATCLLRVLLLTYCLQIKHGCYQNCSNWVRVHLIITIDTFMIQQLCHDTFRILSWYSSFR